VYNFVVHLWRSADGDAQKQESSRQNGSTEARKHFPALVDSDAAGAEPVEITDYGEVVALIVSAKHYDWLLAHTRIEQEPNFKLCGSLTILGDLEEGSQIVADSFRASLKKTVQEL
jgi:prevent-host-death family protein